jgi:hypothetical protein
MIFYIITGCNSSYFKCWINLYHSIKYFLPNSILFFFDLGLTDDERNHIKQYNIVYEKFDFTKYEDWIHINNHSGQWAWKAQCIKTIVDKIDINSDINQYVAWFDSRNLLHCNLEEIFQFIDTNGIYTDITEGAIQRWTFHKTIQYLNAENYMNSCMRNGALQIYNINMKWVRDFIDEYAALSLVKDCIFPEGSSRSNHRQDQSILSILYYKYKDMYHFQESNYNNYISIHNGLPSSS